MEAVIRQEMSNTNLDTDLVDDELDIDPITLETIKEYCIEVFSINENTGEVYTHLHNLDGFLMMAKDEIKKLPQYKQDSKKKELEEIIKKLEEGKKKKEIDIVSLDNDIKSMLTFLLLGKEDPLNRQPIVAFRGYNSRETENLQPTNEQDDQRNLTVPTVSSSVSEDVSTSRSDEEESVVITQGSQNDGEHDKFMPEEHQDDDAMQNTQPKTLVVNSKPSNTDVEGDEKKQALVQPTEPVSKNAQGNSKQPSYPNKNNPNPQDAKSKLPAIAASMLAITGIAIAVHLEMLAVGIAVGVCCLVAAAIIYYCNSPSSSLNENSNAKVVVNKTTVAGL